MNVQASTMMLMGAFLGSTVSTLAQTFYRGEFKEVIAGMGVDMSVPASTEKILVVTLILESKEFESLALSMDDVFGITEKVPAGTARIYQQQSTPATMIIYLMMPGKVQKSKPRRARGRRTQVRARETQLQDLETKLNALLAADAFEEAILVRDQINRLRAEMEAGPKKVLGVKKPQQNPEN